MMPAISRKLQISRLQVFRFLRTESVEQLEVVAEPMMLREVVLSPAK